jgi:hypothetical protein
MKELIVIDDFLSEEDHHKIFTTTVKAPYMPIDDSITDEFPDPLSGQSGYNAKEDIDGETTQILLEQAMMHNELIPIVSTKYMLTIFNKYDPKTPTYFHWDTKSPESGWTLIYFPHTHEYNFKMGGETQILVDNQIVGVLPLPNRLMAFDGSLWHKGTSFTHDDYRYSVAIQFNDG